MPNCLIDGEDARNSMSIPANDIEAKCPEIYRCTVEARLKCGELGNQTEAGITILDGGAFEAFCEMLDEPMPQASLELLADCEEWV
ncbi:MAG: hypothetical protein ACI4B9_04765 [Eggerthellaceae bacterium]